MKGKFFFSQVFFHDTTAFFSFPSRHLPIQSNNRNTRTKCEICSKLTTKTRERRQETLEQGVKYVQS